MARQSSDDCYFFLNSTCTKGELCGFRHSEAARGSSDVCVSWQAGACFNQQCGKRHSVPSAATRDRSRIACYWETQTTGCRKPHCPFLHSKPRDHTGTILTEEDKLANVMSPPPEHIMPMASEEETVAMLYTPRVHDPPSQPSPRVEQIVINPLDEESDGDSVQGTPVKSAASERILELKMPPRTLNTDESNADTDLNFGVKSLEEIRKEKLARAKRLIEEADSLLSLEQQLQPEDAEASRSPAKHTPLRTALATAARKHAAHDSNKTSGEQDSRSAAEVTLPSKKTEVESKLRHEDENEEHSDSGVKTLEEIWREKALASLRAAQERKRLEAEKSEKEQSSRNRTIQSEKPSTGRRGTDRSVITRNADRSTRPPVDTRRVAKEAEDRRSVKSRLGTVTKTVKDRLGLNSGTAQKSSIKSRLGLALPRRDDVSSDAGSHVGSDVVSEHIGRIQANTGNDTDIESLRSDDSLLYSDHPVSDAESDAVVILNTRPENDAPEESEEDEEQPVTSARDGGRSKVKGDVRRAVVAELKPRAATKKDRVIRKESEDEEGEESSEEDEVEELLRKRQALLDSLRETEENVQKKTNKSAELGKRKIQLRTAEESDNTGPSAPKRRHVDGQTGLRRRVIIEEQDPDKELSSASSASPKRTTKERQRNRANIFYRPPGARTTVSDTQQASSKQGGGLEEEANGKESTEIKRNVDQPRGKEAKTTTYAGQRVRSKQAHVKTFSELLREKRQQKEQLQITDLTEEIHIDRKRKSTVQETVNILEVGPQVSARIKSRLPTGAQVDYGDVTDKDKGRDKETTRKVRRTVWSTRDTLSQPPTDLPSDNRKLPLSARLGSRPTGGSTAINLKDNSSESEGTRRLPLSSRLGISTAEVNASKESIKDDRKLSLFARLGTKSDTTGSSAVAKDKPTEKKDIRDTFGVHSTKGRLTLKKPTTKEQGKSALLRLQADKKLGSEETKPITKKVPISPFTMRQSTTNFVTPISVKSEPKAKLREPVSDLFSHKQQKTDAATLSTTTTAAVGGSRRTSVGASMSDGAAGGGEDLLDEWFDLGDRLAPSAGLGDADDDALLLEMQELLS